jgi:uncharacterized protein YndB with AHSA1/START domain
MNSAFNRNQLDAKLDLVLERVVDVPVERVWLAWTTPEHVKKWFTPAPWTTVACEIDLRPGGIFRTVMRSPEGQEFPNVGCYLEVCENERLIWTNALLPGYRPARAPAANKDHECSELLMTAILTLERQGNGTRYTAIALHQDETARARHEQMGFHEGWGAALDQLVDVARNM